MRENILQKLYIPLVIVITIVTVTQFMSTTTEGKNPAKYKILSKTINVVSEKVDVVSEKIDVVSGKVDVVSEKIDAVGAIDKRLDHLNVIVTVDEGWCDGTAASQCNDSDENTESTGHSTNQPATSSNHNPVAVVVLVTLNGQPVQNLTANNFVYERGFQPANAPGIVRCDITECTSDSLFLANGGNGQNGLYAFFLHPFGGGQFLWKKGTYHGLVIVTDDEGRTGIGKAEIEIKQ